MMGPGGMIGPGGMGPGWTDGSSASAYDDDTDRTAPLAPSKCRKIGAKGQTDAVIDHHVTSLAWALKLRQDLPPITSDVNCHLGSVKCPGGLKLDEQTPIAWRGEGGLDK